MGDGKSPGMDGLSAKFYEYIVLMEGPQPLFSAVNSFFLMTWVKNWVECRFTQRSALITTFPKPNMQDKVFIY